MALGLVALALAACASAPGSRRPPAAEERAAAWLEAHRDRPPMLRAFLQRLPKGADLHTHLSGAVYAESYLAWAAEKGLCVVRSTGAIVPPPCGDEHVAARELSADDTLYNAAVDALSVRNLEQSGRTGRDQFFAAFGKFRGADVADQVAEVVDRAGSQHVLYVELMVSLRSGAVRALGRQTGLAGGLAAARERLLAAGLAAEVAAARADLDGVDRRVEGHLGCQTEPRPGCRVTRRYLQQSQRTLSPEEVFAQLVFAFALAEGDPRVVGVNLVGPEDDATALGDYGRHMEMVGFLRGLHPGVGVTLHAGELTLGLVPPAHLRSHIRQAVEVAGARRIGHGTGLAYEDGALGLLGDLRERDVVVEICLTSNDVILGVRGDQHPFPDYLRAGVPVVLGSDDEGVARIDLTHEYERAAGYGLGYGELKDLSRNGLTYGFLPGESLWSGAAGSTVAACAGDPPGAPSPTAPCAAFLAGSERARLQWRLEAAFREFEDLPWW